MGGQGRCDVEVKFFVKIKKNGGSIGEGGSGHGVGSGGWGVRVDVNGEVKFM